jgi:hypothetical protein
MNENRCLRLGPFFPFELSALPDYRLLPFNFSHACLYDCMIVTGEFVLCVFCHASLLEWV